MAGPSLTLAAQHARVAYVIPLNPFTHVRNNRGAPLVNGIVPALEVLPAHLQALASVPSRLNEVMMMMPIARQSGTGRAPAVVPGYEAMLAREMESWEKGRQSRRHRPPLTLLDVQNNTLGSYGLYLHAFHSTRDRFEFYIMSEVQAARSTAFALSRDLSR
jgi:hypothetical protein